MTPPLRSGAIPPKPSHRARGAGLALTAALLLAGPSGSRAHEFEAAEEASKSAAAAAPARAAAPSAWVQQSNGHAMVVMQAFARLSPEGAAQLGVPGLDQEITDLGPGFIDRQMAVGDSTVAQLEARLAGEKDPRVRQDLEIMVEAVRQNMEGARLDIESQLPFFSVSSVVFQGIRALLDDQSSEASRKAAVVRLRKYAGIEKGFEPYAKLAEARIRERMAKPGLMGPPKSEVEKELANSATYVGGIEKLFKKYRLDGWQKAHAELEKQVAAYDAFVRAEILPRARTDFRLPPELYTFQLKQFGNDMPLDELQSRAHASFRELQNQMQSLALLVAREKGWSATDYRAVIRELKKRQLVGEAILPHYEARAKDLERIIREQRIVTLPERGMRIELASEAEGAAVPAPHFQRPRMIGNTGQVGVFVLPLQVPGAPGSEKLAFDDFTFEAASWTLHAHEGRPGHELQFATMIERGVSIARAIFALNSVNVEGWGLYAEAEAQPYLPLDGQLIACQHRLLRAARAILDPGLQAGSVSRDEAMRVLREDVCLSEAMALQEVERYTFRSPGQAPSYFVGYCRLLELRTAAERALGARFDRLAFNDFVLAQGALPPKLMRKAVFEEFIPQRTAATH